ncbi:rRNA methyltransferase 1, mitochondrial [Octopus vulgaris]|uniref:rRNA methyltransferase 1, mitochondrial n=1 Tax=Octopus vulgaris TaxID=6645 RepID=A0AA36AXX6_OCTVU|nr:rRNA methyltransferase 1, mitochondrial [Octopus vulgaris]
MSYQLPLQFVRCSRLVGEKNTNFFHLRQTQLLLTKVKNVIFSSNFSNKSSLPDYNYNLPGEGKRKRRKNFSSNVKLIGEILYGIHPVLLALKKNSRACHKLYIQKSSGQRSELLQQIISLGIERNITVTAFHKEELDKLSGSRPHQGVCMDVSYLKMEELKPETFSQLCLQETEKKSSEQQLFLVLYQVQDPMNFGAILRSAYYFGANKVIFSKENSSIINPVVSKSSAGALELLPMAFTNTEQTLMSLLRNLKKYGWKLVGTVGKNCEFEGKTLKQIGDICLRDPTVLIVGNEGTGVSKQMLRLCDHLVTIRSHVDNKQLDIDSLNVSVATGILLHSLKKTSQTS